MYYLQSRYYDPETGRFINADALASTGQGLLGNNMFAYCNNSPIQNLDSTGTYCRDAAVEYIKEWHDKKNKEYYYYRRGDCANFVSQGLRTGGIGDSDGWYHSKSEKSFLKMLPWGLLSYKYRYNWSSSESWRLADEQFQYFSNPDNGYINGDVIQISSVSDIADIANNGGVQPGDLLYFSSDGVSMHHATMITKVSDGMIYYGAHSSSQFDCPLSEKLGSETVFIIKIFDDA